jgi:alkane 1-monooxygenase
VTEAHSWNSLHRMTNWFLFNLGRHAEHHAHPRVPYQKLKATPRPRTLPFGYSAMLILAWLPPIWRKIFHGGGPQHPGHLTRTA